MKTPGSLAGWPKNAVKAILNLLENGAANAETKALKTEELVISHAQVNMAPKGRRRTYRAHGRINPYMRVPSHIELILSEKPEVVAKEPSKPNVTQFKRKTAARAKVVTGGGA
jgi:large subunit ribosomal protein L17e